MWPCLRSICHLPAPNLFPVRTPLLVCSLDRGPGVDVSVSGTTACVLAMRGRHWVCANVGDSRAVLITTESAAAASASRGSRATDAPFGSGKSRDDSAAERTSQTQHSRARTRPSESSLPGAAAVAVGIDDHVPRDAADPSAADDGCPRRLASRPLSSDHKPTRPDERARVSARPAAHIASENALGISGGGEEKLYVCRVHNGSIRYGVLFTRSIGDADAHAHLGLLATPELTRGSVGPNDVAVVLATDGVWDCISNDEVAGMVGASGGDVHAAAATIARTAKQRWDDSSERRRDDITVVVVSFTLFPDVQAAVADAVARRAAGEAVDGEPIAPILQTDSGQASLATTVATSAVAAGDAGEATDLSMGVLSTAPVEPDAAAQPSSASASTGSAGGAVTGRPGIVMRGVGLETSRSGRDVTSLPAVVGAVSVVSAGAPTAQSGAAMYSEAARGGPP